MRWLLVGFVAWMPAWTFAQDGRPPMVAGFERFEGTESLPGKMGGSLLFSELNCASCHDATQSVVVKRQGPVLDQVGGRVRRSYLRSFLSQPHATKPGTTMPDVLAGLPEKERADKVEALVHFLASTGTPRLERPEKKLINAGRDLYGKVGCVVCHGPRDGQAKEGKLHATAVGLGDLTAKYTLPSLTSFLENPHNVRPGGRMPTILNGKEAKEVAHYLLQSAKVELPGGEPGTLNFAYYEGSWDKLPDFAKLKPKKTGIAQGFDLQAGRRTNDMALKFDGYFQAASDGKYHFHLASDDGAKLFVGGQLVVDNDGVHPTTSQSGSIKLKKGVHQIVVQFFNAGGEWVLDAEVDGPNLPRQSLAHLLHHDVKGKEKKKPAVAKEDPDHLPIDPALVESGKALFASVGCANCHHMAGIKKSAMASKPVANVQGGCLSATPSKSAPWYGLDTKQRQALAAHLKSPAVKPTPQEKIAHTLATFNCYACHVRDKVGGVQEELNKAFLTTQPEMGDEARIPPPLDGVGSKIQPNYLTNLLHKGVHDRPYMHTRMPGFGQANVGHLVDAFRELDKIPAVAETQFEVPPGKVRAEGRHMVGAKVFGCIKCHTFSGQKAEGVQGMDMAILTQRLTRAWFHAYLLDPQKVRPGTRMPASWPMGNSFYDKILDGKASTQIEAIWVYLNGGKGALLPIGMKKQSIPLTPEKSAIVYRNFIEGAGPRAIGVGFPEKANLAFDANDMRLSMLWQGAFIDAARHWTDRGVGFEPPLGDNIIRLPAGPAFAVLKSETEAWPTKTPKDLGYVFKGYQLDPEDRPTFIYQFGNIRIDDFPNGAEFKSNPGIRRSLTLSANQPVEDLYFRAAMGKIEALEGGWFRINGEWQVRFPGSDARLRSVGSQSELLVPIRWQNGRSSLVEEIAW